jgi:hypothetical protein
MAVPVGGSAKAKDEPMGRISNMGRHYAMCDLSGRTLRAVDRTQKIHFVCDGCLLPAYDFCLGWPMTVSPTGTSQNHCCECFIDDSDFF